MIIRPSHLTSVLLFALICNMPARCEPPGEDAPVICVDPGHPSETSAGTISRDGSLTETHLDWVIAKRLQVLLTNSGYRVVMTKSREPERVTNRRRAEIANHAHAVLFLRLHCDSAPTSGLATYYPDRRGTTQGTTGPSAKVMMESHLAATAIHTRVMKRLVGKLRDRGVHGESATRIGARQGALTGSIFAQVPAVTVEMVVLDNRHDFAFAKSEAGQKALAEALFEGVTSYVDSGKHVDHDAKSLVTP